MSHYFNLPISFSRVADLVMMQELGADEVVDYRTEDFAERYKDKPFDLVIDSLGGVVSCHAEQSSDEQLPLLPVDLLHSHE